MTNTKFYFRSGLQAAELRSLSLLAYFGSHQNISSAISVHEYILNHSTVCSISLASLKLCNVCDDVSKLLQKYVFVGFHRGAFSKFVGYNSSSENDP